MTCRKLTRTLRAVLYEGGSNLRPERGEANRLQPSDFRISKQAILFDIGKRPSDFLIAVAGPEYPFIWPEVSPQDVRAYDTPFDNVADWL